MTESGRVACCAPREMQHATNPPYCATVDATGKQPTDLKALAVMALARNTDATMAQQEVERPRNSAHDELLRCCVSLRTQHATDLPSQARDLLRLACKDGGFSFEQIDLHLVDDDYSGFLEHENVALPAYWLAIAWAQSTSAAGGFCTCRRCVAMRRAQA